MRGGVLKAKLRRRLRRELGAEGMGRKRKRGHNERDDEDGFSETDEEVKLEEGVYDALNDPREKAIDAKFFGINGAVLPPTGRRYHTTSSLLEVMQQSLEELGKEISGLDRESEKILAEMQETVGDLSDLRYGKFVRVSGGEQGEDGAIENEVFEALKEVTNVANRKSRQTVKYKAGG